VFQLSDKDYRKMQTAMSEAAFIRALEQDGFTVSVLPAEPPASGDVDAARAAIVGQFGVGQFGRVERLLDTFEAAIRAEGLDVERLDDALRFVYGDIGDDDAEYVRREYARLGGV
jgi:hypothetical protein